jgi:hypothetical protein
MCDKATALHQNTPYVQLKLSKIALSLKSRFTVSIFTSTMALSMPISRDI